MSASIKLKVEQGPMKGKDFSLTEHDTFIFGRMPDCHVYLPDDGQVSRHHFFMEASPPHARIRDLGSLNGTYVNGKKVGGRTKMETPEEGAKTVHPHVDLKDGDKINVGQTILSVQIRVHVTCGQCGVEIPDSDKNRAEYGTRYLCDQCRAKGADTIAIAPSVS